MKSICLFFAALLMFGSAETSAMKKPKKEAVVWPADKIKWVEAKDGPPGLMYADLWGDMNKSAYGSLVKLPAGMKNPLHTHTSDVKSYVVSGTFLYTAEGGEEQRLGPGSYLFIPGGLRHMSGTSEDGPCEMFQQSPGKFDMNPVGQKQK